MTVLIGEFDVISNNSDKEMKLKIVADENMPLAERIFSEFGNVSLVPGRTMSADDVEGADLVLVRSVTQVNETLLAKAEPRFVGTATIGTDHIDTAYLAAQNIAFSSAPGCNADAVVEYVLSSVFHLAQTYDFKPEEKTWGIIGVGNVGGRLHKRLSGLGYNVLLNDPPRADVEGGEGFVDLASLLERCDLICMHTPLTRDGAHPSHHLLGEAELARLREGTLLLNAGRGPVIDNAALLKVKQTRPDLKLVLDVWEHEPVVDPALAAVTEIATPHIAGYSYDGKVRGTYMLYEAVCRLLNRAPAAPLEHYLATPDVQGVDVQAEVSPLDLIRMRYDPFRDDRALRATLDLSETERGQAFDHLRKTYPVRREFSSLSVGCEDPLPDAIAALGFKVAAS